MYLNPLERLKSQDIEKVELCKSAGRVTMKFH